MLYRISSAWLSLRMRFLKMPLPMYFQVRVIERGTCVIFGKQKWNEANSSRRPSRSDTDHQISCVQWALASPSVLCIKFAIWFLAILTNSGLMYATRSLTIDLLRGQIPWGNSLPEVVVFMAFYRISPISVPFWWGDRPAFLSHPLSPFLWCTYG